MSEGGGVTMGDKFLTRKKEKRERVDREFNKWRGGVSYM